MCDSRSKLVVCKHVQAGQKPDVLAGSKEGTEVAVCFACADVVDDMPPEAAMVLVNGVCECCARKLGIPLTLPGDEWDFYDCNGNLLLETPDGRKRPENE